MPPHAPPGARDRLWEAQALQSGFQEPTKLLRAAIGTVELMVSPAPHAAGASVGTLSASAQAASRRVEQCDGSDQALRDELCKLREENKKLKEESMMGMAPADSKALGKGGGKLNTLDKFFKAPMS